MKCSLVFTAGIFTHLHNFILTDHSYITCNNNKRISLSTLHYLKYGLAYYENKFQATPFDIDEINNVKKYFDKRLNTILQKYHKQIINFNFSEDENNVSKYFSSIYNKNMTIKELLDILIKNKECSYYVSLVNMFFTKDFDGLKWKIHVNNIADYEVKIDLNEIEKPSAKHKKTNHSIHIQKIYGGTLKESF